MGVGTLRRHRQDTGSEASRPAPLAALEEPLEENNVGTLAAALEHFEVTDADLEPGSGSGGNVVKADRVESLRRLLDGEPREAVVSGGGEPEEGDGEGDG